MGGKGDEVGHDDTVRRRGRGEETRSHSLGDMNHLTAKYNAAITHIAGNTSPIAILDNGFDNVQAKKVSNVRTQVVIHCRCDAGHEVAMTMTLLLSRDTSRLSSAAARMVLRDTIRAYMHIY